MNDDPMIEASGPASIVGAINSVCPRLEPLIRRRLNAIKLSILAEEGKDGVYAKLNGKTVSQILELYENFVRPPLDGGSLRDIRYTLYDSPPDENNRG